MAKVVAVPGSQHLDHQGGLRLLFVMKQYDWQFLGPCFYLDDKGTKEFDFKMHELKRLEFQYYVKRVRGPHFVRSREGEVRHFEQTPSEGYRFVSSLVHDIIEPAAWRVLTTAKQMPVLFSAQASVYLVDGTLPLAYTHPTTRPGDPVDNFHNLRMQERYAIVCFGGEKIPETLYLRLMEYLAPGWLQVEMNPSKLIRVRGTDHQEFAPMMHSVEFEIL